jgi:hypothetical protein
MVTIDKWHMTKLIKKHKVSRKEVNQCFTNCREEHLLETRPKHITVGYDTYWFISTTSDDRILKIVYKVKVGSGSGGEIILRTAFPAPLTDKCDFMVKYWSI